MFCYKQSTLSLACLYNNFKVELNTIQYTKFFYAKLKLKNLHLCHVLIYYDMHHPQGKKSLISCKQHAVTIIKGICISWGIFFKFTDFYFYIFCKIR